MAIKRKKGQAALTHRQQRRAEARAATVKRRRRGERRVEHELNRREKRWDVPSTPTVGFAGSGHMSWDLRRRRRAEWERRNGIEAA